MKIKNFNYWLVVYLAVIEGISLFVLNSVNIANAGFLVGFIPAIIVLWLYQFTASYAPIKLNGNEIHDFPIVFPSIANGLFIMVLFFIQFLLPVESLIGNALFGFASVFLSFFILVLVYNMMKFKMKFLLGERIVTLTRISPLFSVYAGIFELFILPLMDLFYKLGVNPFLNGLCAGFLGGTIGAFVVLYFMEKKPLEVSL